MATSMMTRSRTETRDVVEIARLLADEFREGAAEYDRTGEFPSANYDRMREAGSEDLSSARHSLRARSTFPHNSSLGLTAALVGSK